ncbi:hypothetical protein AOC03_05915 [Psychrobacter urativorans]|uniref:Uncharacterized protein n=1 Tax=Psychrobacter urativorans TaxID=45610 RepID=A0A0M5MJT1_9GAMM|nr:hypothetical protein AOC03_05915 [Psychrobacter urativorans]
MVFIVSLILVAIINYIAMVQYLCMLLDNITPYQSAITILITTISLFIYNHIDTIIKDIPEVLRDTKKDLYNSAIDSLTALKNEIISNLILAVSILLVSYIVNNLKFFSCNINYTSANLNLLATIFFSLTLIYIIFDQISAFKFSSEYRSLIKKG